MSVFTIAGAALSCIGFIVTVIFWIPGIVNRKWLREILGSRYRIIYLIYVANGPMLMILGILLMLFTRKPAAP